jgi:nucleoporin NUP82
LEGSEGGDATDITYLAFGTDEEEGDGEGGETEHLGVVMIAFQDGKVDVCLDVEKVEAKWESRQVRFFQSPFVSWSRQLSSMSIVCKS